MSDNKMEVIPAANPYPLEPANMHEIIGLIEENLRGRPISIQEFQRIKVPSGGGLAYRMDTASGEESPRTFEGIIIAWRSARIYWRKAYGGKGGSKKPPDCTSIDGFVGVGDPGGDCGQCPYARFGSAINPIDGSPSGGQACKDIRQALVLLPNQIVPHILNVPPTSVKNFSHYTLQLLSMRTRAWGAVTEFALEKATNEDGVDYAKAIFRLSRRLTPEEQQTLAPYQEHMKRILAPSVVDASVYEIDDSSGKPSAALFRPTDVPRDDDVPF